MVFMARAVEPIFPGMGSVDEDNSNTVEHGFLISYYSVARIITNYWHPRLIRFIMMPL